MLILSTRSSPLATLVCALVAGASSSDVARAPLLSKPSKSSSRIDDLEALIRRQSLQLEMQSARIADLERTVAKEFEVMHYNVLADQAGKNMVPWFCYGADVTEEERKELHKRFYAMGDKNKRAADKGWPTWAEGILSAERIAAVEAYDAARFCDASFCVRCATGACASDRADDGDTALCVGGAGCHHLCLCRPGCRIGGQ